MLEKQSFNSGVITSILEPGSFPPSHPLEISLLDSVASSLQARMRGLRCGLQ